MPVDEWLPGLVGVLLLTSVAGWLTRHLVEWLRSTSWPSVDAVITEASVESVDGDSLGTEPRTAVARVGYRYLVGGQQYFGRRVRFGDFIDANLFTSKETVARYPPGTHVQVFYDPASPERSTLERRALVRLWLFCGLAWGLVLTVARSLLVHP